MYKFVDACSWSRVVKVVKASLWSLCQFTLLKLLVSRHNCEARFRSLDGRHFPSLLSPPTSPLTYFSSRTEAAKRAGLLGDHGVNAAQQVHSGTSCAATAALGRRVGSAGEIATHLCLGTLSRRRQIARSRPGRQWPEHRAEMWIAQKFVT